MNLDQLPSGVGGVGGIPQTPGSTPVEQREGKLGSRTVQSMESVKNQVPKSSIPTAPPPPSLSARKTELAESKPIVGQADTSESKETEKSEATAEPQKKTLKEKIKHLFGEIKRFLKHEQWSQLPQEKLNQLPDGELKQDLEARNERVQELSDLKSKAKTLEKSVDQYESSHKDSLKALRDVRPPQSGVLIGGGGEEFDFTSLVGRAKAFEGLKASFENSPDYKQYKSDYQELVQIPEKRQVLKDQLHAVNDELKLKVDMAADKITDRTHSEIDRRVADSGSKTASGIRELQENHLEQITGKEKEILEVEAKLKILKERKNQIRDQTLPMLKAKFASIGKSTQRALKQIEKKAGKLEPSQLTALKNQAIAGMRERRTKVLAEMDKLKLSVKSYPEERDQLRNQLKTEKEDLKALKKGKGVQEDVKALKKEDKNVAKQASKDYKAAPKEASKITEEMHKQLRGRNNKVG